MLAMVAMLKPSGIDDGIDDGWYGVWGNPLLIGMNEEEMMRR
jgi:hypothetical protein